MKELFEAIEKNNIQAVRDIVKNCNSDLNELYEIGTIKNYTADVFCQT